MTVEIRFDWQNEPAFERPVTKLRNIGERHDLTFALDVDEDPECPECPEDAFRLDCDGGVARISGQGVRARVYAIHELIRQIVCCGWRPPQTLAIEREPVFIFRGAHIHDNPGEEPYKTRFRDPDTLLEYGYNCQIVHSHTAVCSYDETYPEFYPQGSDERAWVLAKRAEIRVLIERAKRHHLKVYLNGDLFTFPQKAIEIEGATHEMPGGEPFAHRNGPGYCAASPQVAALVEATYDELFRHFPQVDGILARTGECFTQSEPTLRGNTPVAGTCEKCADLTQPGKLGKTVETVARIVCDKHDKAYIQRTWSYWPRWHSQNEEYLEAIEGVQPRDKLMFSFKQPRTDYWRYNELNPNFGVGDRPQCAEFQCQREYEAKQSFPNYMGGVYAQGGDDGVMQGGIAAMAQRGVRAGWCWALGGGWKGPYLQCDDWAAINVYALGRLFWDPQSDSNDIARDWIRLEYPLPPDSSIPDRFASAMAKSQKAMLGARYVKDAASVHGRAGWSPCHNWFRDDKFSDVGMREMHAVLLERGKVDEAIQEKVQAHETYLSLVEDFQAIVEQGDRTGPWTRLMNTVQYGEAWMAVTRHYFAATFEWLSWKAENKASDNRRQRSLDALDQWRAAWQRLNTASQQQGAASMMQDKGMFALCQEAEAELR